MLQRTRLGGINTMVGKILSTLSHHHSVWNVIVLTSIYVSIHLSLRGNVDAKAAYDLLESGCENAGGLAYPPSGNLHDLAKGGKFQKDEGCTIDAHCDQFNPALGNYFCDTSTGSCERVVVPCTGVQKEVVVDIRTDNYPSETTWTVTDLCGYGDTFSGGPYSNANRDYSSSNDVCEGQYQFTLNVSYSLSLRASLQLHLLIKIVNTNANFF